MKKILLLRHCKSDWSFNDISDHNRPLNLRGKADVLKVGARLFKLKPTLQKVYASSAKRATTTAELAFKNWEGLAIQLTPELYTFSVEDLIQFIKKLPPTEEDVAIVAHNPGLTDLICTLTHIYLDNLPTGGFCRMEFEMDNWDEIENVIGKVKFLEYPKMLHD